MIELNDVRKVFPATRGGREVVALDGVSLRVDAGDFAGVVGPSGSGKSTLIRLVNLLERPTSGSVTVDGRVLTDLSADEVRRARSSIGMVFQHFELMDSRTAAANVEHPLELAGVGRAERRRRSGELLDLVGLGDRAQARPAQLSGGLRHPIGVEADLRQVGAQAVLSRGPVQGQELLDRAAARVERAEALVEPGAGRVAHDAAIQWRQLARDHFQQSRLAAAVRPGDADALPAGDDQAERA